jgi:hypothetical protein
VAFLRQHWETAVELERTALRLGYLMAEPQSVGASHFNLSLYLNRTSANSCEWFAHRIAQGLICLLTGMNSGLQRAVVAIGRDLRALRDESVIPSTIDEVVARVEQVEGVRFGDLLHALQPDPTAREQALAALLGMAHMAYDISRYLNSWEPVIASAAGAARGDSASHEELDRQLANVAEDPEVSALVAVIHRIVDGERDRQHLLTGLNPAASAIATAILDRLAES